MSLEDKVRRRLAPFIVEGRISKPAFSRVENMSETEHLTVSVRPVRPTAKKDGLELALQNAMRDLAGHAQLIIHHA